MAIPDSPVQVSRLGPRDNDDMLALTGLVYAGFFRPRTAELGDYVGIRVDGRLVSMAGERMHPHGWCELSGICTHLEHTGRGYARRLVAQLVQEIFARGETPFLHVEHTNVHASSLYERWGFEYRRDLELWRAVNGPPDPARTGHAHAHMRRA
jgi:ribosomal protein S18 acetylase RimI-like enzyme